LVIHFYSIRDLPNKTSVTAQPYTDEALHVFENTYIYDAHINSIGNYLHIATQVQRAPNAQAAALQLIRSENDLKDANFRLQLWIDDCLKRLKAKQDALGN